MKAIYIALFGVFVSGCHPQPAQPQNNKTKAPINDNQNHEDKTAEALKRNITPQSKVGTTAELGK